MAAASRLKVPKGAVLEGMTRAAAGTLVVGSEDVPWSSLRARYVNASTADLSGGADTTAVRHWIRFCLARNLSAIRVVDTSSPLEDKLYEEALVMDFTLWLVHGMPTGQTISIDSAVGYVSTMKAWHHRKHHRPIAGGLDMSRQRDLVKGLRRLVGQPLRRPRYGVRTQHLAESLERCLRLDESNPMHVRLNKLNWRAALTLGFCGLLRAAELALQPGESWHPELHLSRADVSFHRDSAGRRYVCVMMRPVKNGRTMRGKSVPLRLYEGGSLLNAYAELKALIEFDPVPAQSREATPLFRLRMSDAASPEAVTTDNVRQQVQAMMKALGLDPSKFGGHSLRIGGATAAHAAGVSPATLRLLGRWNSDIYEIYTRLTGEAAAGFACLIGSTKFEDLERGEFHDEEFELLPEEMAGAPEFATA